MNQTRHKVHERGLAGSIRTDQAGDARRDSQRDSVNAKNLAVEFGDVFKNDLGVHRITSTGRSFRYKTTSSKPASVRTAIVEEKASGPRAGCTPSIERQICSMD